MSGKKSAIVRAKERSKLLARQARMADAEKHHAIKVVQASLQSVRGMLATIVDVIDLHVPVTKVDRGKEREVCKVCKVAHPCPTRKKLVASADTAEKMLASILGVQEPDEKAS